MSSEGRGQSPSDPAPTRVLPYDLTVPYAAELGTARLPWLDVGIDFLGGPSRVVTIRPLLDTGAAISIFDGRVAQAAGLSWSDVTRRALDVKPVHGLAYTARVVEGHELEVACYVGSAVRFAELRFRVLVTPPDSIALPVLGRAGFFEQVGVTFAEFEKLLYLRFRDPAHSRLFA